MSSPNGILPRLTRIERDLEEQIRASKNLTKAVRERPRASWLEWATGLTVPVVMAFGVLILKNRESIAKIEETRFTREDALTLERRLLQRPEWLREDLQEMKEGIRDLQRRLREIEKR